jgi:hypothetical protein
MFKAVLNPTRLHGRKALLQTAVDAYRRKFAFDWRPRRGKTALLMRAAAEAAALGAIDGSAARGLDASSAATIATNTHTNAPILNSGELAAITVANTAPKPTNVLEAPRYPELLIDDPVIQTLLNHGRSIPLVHQPPIQLPCRVSEAGLPQQHHAAAATTVISPSTSHPPLQSLLSNDDEETIDDQFEDPFRQVSGTVSPAALIGALSVEPN